MRPVRRRAPRDPPPARAARPRAGRPIPERSRRGRPDTRRQNIHAPFAPGQLIGREVGRLLGAQGRRPSWTRPDGPWFAHLERAGRLGKAPHAVPTEKAQATSAQASLNNQSNFPRPMNHDLCLIRVFARKDEDEVFEVAALDWEPARTGRAGAFGDAEAKAVNRFARPRTPRQRCPRFRKS